MTRRRVVRENADVSAIVDYRWRSVEDQTDLSFLRQAVYEVLPQLTRNQEQVIRLIYGFNRSGLPLSNAETARVLKVTESRVRCLRCLAIARLYAKFGAVLLRYLSNDL